MTFFNSLNNTIIRGDNNIIIGDHNIIHGNNCSVTGDCNVIYGDDNVGYGDNSDTFGQNNHIIGNNHQYHGPREGGMDEGTDGMTEGMTEDRIRSQELFIKELDDALKIIEVQNAARRLKRNEWLDDRQARMERRLERQRLMEGGLSTIKGTDNLFNSDDPTAKPCVICLDNQAHCVAIPCGHLSYCVNCANHCLLSKITNCAICRKYVNSFYYIYN